MPDEEDVVRAIRSYFDKNGIPDERSRSAYADVCSDFLVKEGLGDAVTTRRYFQLFDKVLAEKSS